MELDGEGRKAGSSCSGQARGGPEAASGPRQDAPIGGEMPSDHIGSDFQDECSPMADPFSTELPDYSYSSVDDPQLPVPEAAGSNKPKKKKKKLSKAAKRAQARASFHDRWTKLLPLLVAPYLDWTNATTAQVPPSLPPILSSSCSQNCKKKVASIACLFQNSGYLSPFSPDTTGDAYLDHATHSIHYCPCEPLAVILIKNGLFPCAPSQPKQAIHIPLLDFYQALFERSCDAVNALVSALATHYTRRGFPVRHSNVSAFPLARAVSY